MKKTNLKLMSKTSHISQRHALIQVHGANGANGVHVRRRSVEYKQGQENASMESYVENVVGPARL